MPKWEIYSEDKDAEYSRPAEENFSFEKVSQDEKKHVLDFGRLILINNGAEWEERNLERAMYLIETREMSGIDTSNLYLRFQAFIRTERKSDGWRDYDLSDYIMKVSTFKDLSRHLGLPKERFDESQRFDVHIVYNPLNGGSVAGISD